MPGTPTRSPGRSTADTPERTLITSAASSTVRAIGPTWSSDHDSGTTPSRDTRSYVGLRPTTPFSAAGTRIDPPVSVPSEKAAIPAATATADPPLDPPATRPVSRALTVCGVISP
ncbi:hypothetical protein GCM10017786_23380 [Amycolatopsis deserti]|uniref:Uncharacterized protein n=1 Tax=Amycolatopsis deserti TaxID=185696 RepID=A0ABQ3IUR7_9PSEU|nr:hypothetical protein GCM10017786_23380 [Amycolatopsis deserti]